MDAADGASDSFKCPLCGNALSTTEYRDVEEKVKAEAKQAAQKAQHDMEAKMNEELEKVRQDAEKKTAEMERRFADREADMEKRIAEQVQAQTREITNDAEKAASQNLDLKYENDKLQEQIKIKERQFEEYKKKQDGHPSWLRGRVGENVLFNALVERFPNDDFVKEKPGQETADIIQRIKHEGAYLDTPICYDNKDDKKVSVTDTKKAKKYRTIHSTPYVIIVTRSMPAKSNLAITTKDGVLLVHPYIISDVVSVIRDGIIKIAAAAANAEDRDGKEADLYRYITGDDFTTRVARLLSIRDDMATLQEQEKKDHERIWKKRDEMLDIMSSQLVDVKDNISKITQGVLQKIKAGRSG